MSKRHATIIIGLLAAILIGVALVAGPRQSTGQAEPRPILASAVETPPMPTMSAEDEAKLKAELRKHTEDMLTSLPPAEIVSGKETAGRPIIIAEKEYQVPPDVYVAHYIISTLCGGSGSGGEYGKCPQAPLYVLAYLDNPEKTISINTNTGIVQDNPDKPAEANLKARDDFAWLIQAIGKEVTK